MAESILSIVVERLGDLLIQEADSLHRVRGQVEQLQTEMKLMQSFLKDADERQDEDERVRDWVSEFREAAYDAEDVVDTFMVNIASRQRGGIQNAVRRYASIFNEAVELHKVGSKIAAIKIRISNLIRSLQTYGIKHRSEDEGLSSVHGIRQQRRPSHSRVVEGNTVGLDSDVKILAAQLVNDEKQYGVISICGMGGLGKTTLAGMVYHHSDVRRHFDAFAWASISQQCQPRYVWQGILSKFTSPSKEQREEIKELRDEDLMKKLYQLQLQKKCLVILDDVWTNDAWDSLRHAFPVTKAGSKILLTTRSKEVAHHVDNGRGFLHELRCLTEEDGWRLFKGKAFPGKVDSDFRIDTNMEMLGRKIVKKCGGLPLAIVVLGGLLAKKHTLNEWHMAHENITSYLRRGKGLKEHYSGVFQALALNYHELPYHLKPCFIHLGHFPEDYDIPTEKLVRMWVAEGIVSPMQCKVEGEETLEDVAEGYLSELLDRCIVQEVVRGSTGRLKTCKMHDLVRDFCLCIASQENFLKVVHIQDADSPMVTFSTPVTITKSIRVHRLAIYSGKGEETYRKFSWECERTPYLRSLLCFSTHRYDTIMPQKMKSIFNGLKLLRILDLERCNIAGKLPKAIGNLIQLRYLSLMCSFISNIPSSIGNLRCLQTLILQTNQSVEIKVPNVIWKMEQLRHLYLPIYTKKSWGKLQLGNLRNLQTLRGFDSRSWDVKELIKLTNLKKLGIIYLESFKELEELLRESSVTLNCLRSVEISIYSMVRETDLQGLLSGCHHLYKLSLTGWIEKLPEYHQFPPNLTKLTLKDSELVEDLMATLEKLPNLSILCLSVRAFIGKKMVCSSRGFPHLKSLVLSNLPNLEEWCVGEAAMPSLCELVIEGCSKLKMVPDGLRLITTLRELEIVRMPIAFENRLRVVNEGGEDLYKVRHVPSIIIV